MADEGPPDGFETAPERRRKRLPALFALAALVVVGATLGVVASLGDGGGNPDVVVPPGTGTTGSAETGDLLGSDVELLPSGRGPCVNDETQRCRNWFLRFSNEDGPFVPLEQREALVRTQLRSAGFEYVGSFELAEPSEGIGLRFRRGPERVAIYLQRDAAASECPASDSSCADFMSLARRASEP